MRKQAGMVVILAVFILSLMVMAYIFSMFNSDKLRVERDQKTIESLNEAKQALIAWAVSHPSRLGQMPFPDRGTGGGYDGYSDCYTGIFQYSFLLGQLPEYGQTSPCITPRIGLGAEFRDAQGNKLWYAVSRNLVRQYQSPSFDPVINPGIVNNPTYQWLQVLDRNGNVISNRVAALIIAPGDPIGGQDRSSGTASASEYLDSFQIGAAIYSNRGYISPDEDFVMGEDSRNVSSSDTTYVQPYYFNDKLVYITIDELMSALEKRVAAEVKDKINKYKLSKGYYPYASILGGYKNYSCVNSKLSGALPIAPSHASSCSYTGGATSSASNCSFSEVDSVTFTKTGTNFNASSNNCVFSGRSCTCTGAGSCTRGTRQFTCDAAGACSANMAGSYGFDGGVFDIGVTSPSLCTSTCGLTVACSGVGSANFAHSFCSDSPFNDVTTNSQLPTWFIANSWQDYIYYAMQRGVSSTLTVGTKTGVNALIITTGYPIIAPYAASKGTDQIRLSCAMNDSLDTNTNVNGNVTNVYESLNKQRSQNYNDQIFVVSP